MTLSSFQEINRKTIYLKKIYIKVKIFNDILSVFLKSIPFGDLV